MSPAADPPEPTDPTDPPDEGRGTRRFHLKLSSLYLDPNNYRFIDNESYTGPVSDEDAAKPEVQARTRKLLLGEKQSNVEDLLASLKQNGWLDMEPIQVRQVGARYFVVEGNRRVATLKYLSDQHTNGGVIGALDPVIFEKVPVVRVAETDPVHHLVVKGLQNISGKRSWPAISQAYVMRELRDRHGMAPEEICRALSISRRELNLSMRTLALVEEYKKSDYGDQFTSGQFNLFREVLKAPELRKWIAWDDSSESAKDRQHLERLFSWLSVEKAVDHVDSKDTDEHASSQKLEPVITTGNQVRELAQIIGDPETEKILDVTRDLQMASLGTGILGRDRVEVALERIDQSAKILFMGSTTLRPEDIGHIQAAVDRLSGVLLAAGRGASSSSLSHTRWAPYNEFRDRQFKEVCVESYRGLRGVSLDGLGRINLIAGVNNAGKTSILESIFLLSHQCDSRALLEVARLRAHTEKLPESKVLTALLPPEASISGHFDGRRATLRWQVTEDLDDDQIDVATFERQIKMEAEYGDRKQQSTTILRAALTPQIKLQGAPRILGPAELSSPFSLAEPASLTSANEASTRTGVKEEILELLRERFAPELQGIELVDSLSRFLVREKGRAQGEDLGTYGEGMQRVFHIAMLLAGVPGGVFLIDEFENAIHPAAYVPFAALLVRLAKRFNTQIFLTTHSAEVLDAWTSSEDLRAEVVGYGVRRARERVEAVRFDGERLHALREGIGLDLRSLT